MADEQGDEGTKDATTSAGAQLRAGRGVDPRYMQRNLANRLFPGPTELMSSQLRQRIEGLLKPLDSDAAPSGRGHRKTRAPALDDGSRPPRTAPGERGAATVEPPAAATPEDIAQVRETLEKQNELLQAILASSVDTQEDARSTAQNSRTFAWAGTAIALLTLVATVISVVAAVRAQ